MPTSLTYFIPSARGFSPWRPDAVMGTAGRETRIALSSRIFKGRWGCSRTPRKPGRSASRPALSPGEPIPGVVRTRHRDRPRVGCQRGKRTLLWDPRRRLLAPFALPRRTSPPGPGILTRFPFGPGATPSTRWRRDASVRRPPPAETRSHPIARPSYGLTPSLRTD